MNSTVRRRPVIISLTGAALIAAVLSGCSGTTDTDPTVKPTPTSSTSTSASAAPTDVTTSTANPTAPSTPGPVPSTAAATAPQDGTATKPSAQSGSSYRLADPATWTIAGNEVGPIAIGGRTTAETDDLSAAYQRSAGACPAAPETQFWGNEENPALIVTTNTGKVSGVAVGNYEPDAVLAGSPKTAEGAGIGTSLTELQRLYPQLTYLGTYLDERAGYSMWGIDDHGGHITFQLGEDGKNVGMVWVSPHAKPPYEFCG